MSSELQLTASRPHPIGVGAKRLLAKYLTPDNLLMLGVSAGLLGLYLFLRSFSNNWTRDASVALNYHMIKRQALEKMNACEWSVVDLFEELVGRTPHKEALVYVDHEHGEDGAVQRMTYKQVDECSNRVAHWALREGIVRGEVVAVMLENSPMFLCVWLGLAKVGAVAALINTNLKGSSLVHSLRLAGTSRFIIGANLTAQCPSSVIERVGGRWFACARTLGTLMDDGGALGNPDGGALGNPDGGALGNLDATLSTMPCTRVDSTHRSGIRATDDLWYVYTSGTTGLPKAARVTHLRFYVAGLAFSRGLNITESDRVFTTLPLYASSGIICTATCWNVGATLVLKRTHANFWDACVAHNASVVQYGGDLAETLVRTHKGMCDRRHAVRLAFGSGMRPDTWKEFQRRFKVPQIGEFYGCTEGNMPLMNTANKYAAAGFVPSNMKRFCPVFRLVRFNFQEEMPYRHHKTGMCVECKPNETGELLIRVDASDPLCHLKGYTEHSDTEMKIITDVFSKGDRWFRTGDLLSCSKEGFFTFVDRSGDTFRWKGENVSTMEVADVISTIDGIVKVAVYGVKIPRHEGRAGMAALVVDETFDTARCFEKLRDNLAAYATPMFLRILSSNGDEGHQAKFNKSKLRDDGFHPDRLSDTILYRDDAQRNYLPLTSTVYRELVRGGKARL